MSHTKMPGRWKRIETNRPMGEENPFPMGSIFTFTEDELFHSENTPWPRLSMNYRMSHDGHHIIFYNQSLGEPSDTTPALKITYEEANGSVMTITDIHGHYDKFEKIE